MLPPVLEFVHPDTLHVVFLASAVAVVIVRDTISVANIIIIPLIVLLITFPSVDLTVNFY